ncbi:MAG: O-antigen ligase family protein [Patescibacteria group bacterium]|jgi:O-antigen ligase
MLTYLLITIYLLFFAYVCIRRLDWGVYLVLLTLPSYGVRLQLGFLPLTLLELEILVLFLVWFWRAISSKFELWPQSKFAKWSVLILVIATISMLVSPELVRAAGIWKAYFVEAILFFIIFSSVIKTSEQLRNVVHSLGLVALVISVFAIIQKFTNGFLVPYQYWYLGEGPRVTSFYSYPNAVGLFVAPIVMMMVGYLVSIKRHAARSAQQVLEIVFLVSTIVCGALAIWWAHSDGALVGLAAGLVVFGLLVKKTRWYVVGAILFLIFYFLLFGLPSSIMQKLTFSDWSGSVRLTIWAESWNMIKNHWLLGAGLAGYQSAIVPYHQAKYIEIFLYPHNFVINFWSELGLAGLIVFLGSIVHYFWIGLRTVFSRKDKDKKQGQIQIFTAGLVAAMVTILVHGLVDVPYFKNDLAVLWWMFFGLMSVVAYGASIGVILTEDKKEYNKK